jgi:hypothetical protein
MMLVVAVVALVVAWCGSRLVTLHRETASYHAFKVGDHPGGADPMRAAHHAEMRGEWGYAVARPRQTVPLDLTPLSDKPVGLGLLKGDFHERPWTGRAPVLFP